jgi:hypothetical protein
VFTNAILGISIKAKATRMNGKQKFRLSMPKNFSKLHFLAFSLVFAAIPGYLILFAGAAPGSIYYVSPVGLDTNPGTEAQPWKTIQKAASSLTAGETVYIKAGTYTGTVSPRNSGTAGNPISYRAYPGQEQQAVLSGAGFEIFGKSYITVSGLKLQSVPGLGFYVLGPGSNLTFSGNYIFGAGSSGFGVWGAAWQAGEPDSALTDITIENNKIEKANDGGFNENITLANGVDRFEVRNNELSIAGNNINGGEGIDAKYGVKNGKIYGNKVHDLGRIGIYVDGASRYALNIDVFNNIVYNTPSTGITLGKEGAGSIDNIKVYNNIVYNHGRDGIDLFPHFNDNKLNVRNIYILNNTTYGNGYEVGHGGGGISVTYPEAQNVVVKNNIAYKNTDFQLRSDAGIVSNNLTTDPLFVDELNKNFQLKSNSPAINTGANLSTLGVTKDYLNVTRPQGAAYDIGAYEYTTTPPKQADINGDGSINVTDLSILLSNYQKPGNFGQGDLNGDGIINILDLSQILSLWGT